MNPMVRTSWSLPLLISVAALVAGAVLTERLFNVMPPIRLSLSATFYVLALANGVLAWKVKLAIQKRQIGQDRRQWHPVTMVRILALAKASIVVGALFAGLGIGVAVAIETKFSAVAAAQDDVFGVLAVIVGALAVGITGWVLEGSCQDRDHDESAKKGSS